MNEARQALALPEAEKFAPLEALAKDLGIKLDKARIRPSCINA